MKNKKKSSSKKILVVPVVLAVAVVGIFFLNKQHSENQNAATQSNTNQTVDEQPAQNTINYSPSDPADNDDINKRKETADQSKPVTDPSLNATITYAAQNNDLSVLVRVLIEGTTTGSCKLTLTNGSTSTIEKAAPVIVRGNISTCDGFTVPKNELGPGEWKALVVVEADGKTSDAGEATFKIL